MHTNNSESTRCTIRKLFVWNESSSKTILVQRLFTSHAQTRCVRQQSVTNVTLATLITVATTDWKYPSFVRRYTASLREEKVQVSHGARRSDNPLSPDYFPLFLHSLPCVRGANQASAARGLARVIMGMAGVQFWSSDTLLQPPGQAFAACTCTQLCYPQSPQPRVSTGNTRHCFVWYFLLLGVTCLSVL